MNYSSIEEVYGSPFGQRVPVTHARKDAKEDNPISKQATLEEKTQSSIDKNKALIESVSKTLPLDKEPQSQTFDPMVPIPRVETFKQRERFTMPMSGGGGDDDKLSRILRLIEQNRTGYEPASAQDMLLYIATGVFFLFTFDTFVTLGRTMRGRN